MALSEHADVLLITERSNLRAECAGLSIADDVPRLQRGSYRSEYALRSHSLVGFIERWRIRRAIRKFSPDVVHIQEQGDTFTATIAEEVAQKSPLVVTVHDPVPHSGNDGLVAARFADGLRRIRAAAHAFHVHGAYCEAMLRQRLATQKPITATAHGVILVQPGQDPHRTADRFLFFGRMEAYKGLDVLLEAIDLLPKGHGLRFVLAGRGPELERHRARLATQPAVEIVEKFLPPTEAVSQFRRARAVVVPYRDATQSGVISAAVGNGVPVIASRVGGLADAVEDQQTSDEKPCGLLVPPSDPSALASALLAMADDATRQRLAEGANEAAAGRFAWTSVAARLCELYAQLPAAR